MPALELSSLPDPPSLIERDRDAVATALKLAPAAALLFYGVACVLRQEAFVFEYVALTHVLDPAVRGLEAVLTGLRYVLFGLAAAAWLWDRPFSQALEVVRVMAVIHGLVGGFALFVLAAVLA